MSYYPPAPAERFAYDVDGSLVTFSRDLTHVAISQADIEKFNNEYIGMPPAYPGPYTEVGPNSVEFEGARLSILFPDPRTLTHFYWSQWSTLGFGSGTWLGEVSVEVSEDSTNGQDGTWVVVAGDIPKQNHIAGVSPLYREALIALDEPAESITGVRLNVNRLYASGIGTTFVMAMKCFHIWGQSATSNKLALWDSSTDLALAPAALDWGDVPQGHSGIKQFRVKNLHNTLTATSVTITRSVLSDTSPSVLSTYELSDDGDFWVTNLSLSNLAPGALSDTCYLRKASPNNANPALHSVRIKAAAGSWS